MNFLTLLCLSPLSMEPQGSQGLPRAPPGAPQHLPGLPSPTLRSPQAPPEALLLVVVLCGAVLKVAPLVLPYNQYY